MSFREIARRMTVPQDFLAKILKQLVTRRLVASTRGAHGGYSLGRPARDISFLEVIEAVEGPVMVNLCQEGHDACRMSRACTLYGVWKRGQEQMLDVYRTATLDQLAMGELRMPEPVHRSPPPGAEPGSPDASDEDPPELSGRPSRP